MNSGIGDFISECGVGRKKGESLLGFFKSVLLGKTAKNRREVSRMGADELVARHNMIFGIDSSDPTAALRYDLRKKPATSSVQISEEEDAIFTPVNKIGSFSGIVVSDPSCFAAPSPTSQGGVISLNSETYNSDAPTDIEKYTDEGSEEVYFPGLEEKYTESEEVHAEPVRDIGTEMDLDAAELDDVATEETEIRVRELTQMTIDDPVFEAPEGCEISEPVIACQKTLEVEFETESAEDVRVALWKAEIEENLAWNARANEVLAHRKAEREAAEKLAAETAAAEAARKAEIEENLAWNARANEVLARKKAEREAAEKLESDRLAAEAARKAEIEENLMWNARANEVLARRKAEREAAEKLAAETAAAEAARKAEIEENLAWNARANEVLARKKAEREAAEKNAAAAVAETVVSDVSVSAARKVSGVSFRFGNAASAGAVTSGIRFLFGTASD